MTAVRRITEHDAAVLRTVRLAALADAPSAFGSTLERELAFPDDEWRARAAAAAHGDAQLTLLAWDGAEVAGIVSGFRAAERPDVVDLVSMWTHPSVRRCGVGGALVQGVLDWSRAIGAARVELWVVRGNEPALRLYERMGFTVTDEHQPHPNDPCAMEIRMVLDLR